jgi:hypothetical protein
LIIFELIQITDYSLAKISTQGNKWFAEKTKEELFSHKHYGGTKKDKK